MNITRTQVLEDALFRTLGGADSPLYTVDDGLRLRFDAIRLSKSETNGMLNIAFYHRGDAIARMHVATPRFDDGDTLNLCGIEGSVSITIT